MLKIGNAPCSWGVIEGSPRSGLTYSEVLDDIARAGYDGLELGPWGFMPTEPAKLKTELQSRNLELVGSWVEHHAHIPERLEDDIRDALESARLLAEVGIDRAMVILGGDFETTPNRFNRAGRITAEDGMSSDQWKVFTDGISKIAQAVQSETGVECVFHPHCANLVETPAEVDTFMNMTDPDVVNLCLDVGHTTFGGGDALAALRKHRDRVHHIHLKNCDPVAVKASRAEGWDYHKSIEEGVFCRLRDGMVDLKAILDELKATNYNRWLLIEQDLPPVGGTPYENAYENLKYIRSINQPLKTVSSQPV